MKALSGKRLEDWVREELANADPDIASVLSRYPEAVVASEDPRAVKTGWIPPDPFTVLVFTEYGIGDPYYHEHVLKVFDRVGKKLRKQPGVDDGGWESYRAGVQYFWVKPTQAELKLNPAGLTAKGERMYRHVKESYAGDPRAKEIAARTVYVRASEGVPGLRRRANPPRPGEIGRVILDSMANTLWVTSYADWADRIAEDDPDLYERLRDRGRVPRPGGRWDDVAPEPPLGARQAARTLLGLLERDNQTSIEDLLSRATEADRKAFPPSVEYTELFGHYLAMEALGHGVSWFDDHKRFSIKFPRFETYSSDGRTLEWSPR